MLNVGVELTSMCQVLATSVRSFLQVDALYAGAGGGRVRQGRRPRGWGSRRRDARCVPEDISIGGAGTAKPWRETILPTFDAILIDEAQDLTIAPTDLRFSEISLRLW